MRTLAAGLALALSSVVLIALGAPPAGAAAEGDGAILERRLYTFAAYDSVPALAKLCSREAYAEVVKDRRFAMERIVYSSGGFRVAAYVYAPTARPVKPQPVVVFNRGGYVQGDFGAELAPMLGRLARAGFVVIAPLYRGSGGGEGRDEMGGAELADLMNVVPLARRLGLADTSRIFLYGESRGGMMVFQALRDGFPAKAAAVYGAFTDLDTLIASDHALYDRLCVSIWPDFATHHDAIATRRSALRWAENLRTPLLLMHGGADSQVSPAQTLQRAGRLQRLGREYELHLYAGDGHVLRRNQADRDSRAAEWFRRHEGAGGE